MTLDKNSAFAWYDDIGEDGVRRWLGSNQLSRDQARWAQQWLKARKKAQQDEERFRFWIAIGVAVAGILVAVALA